MSLFSTSALERSPIRVLAVLLACLASCAGPSHRIVHGATGIDTEVEAMVDAMADADVVFLGEQHTSDIVHDLQIRVTEALAARRGTIAISLEMFERDVQDVLDDYLAGNIDEETFLENSRPWGNYAEHYRPVIELAKARGFDVIAANCPRPLAAKVAKEGLDAVLQDPEVAAHVAASVDVTEDRYHERFLEAMGDHAGVDDENMARIFAAQCLKDDTMAESIARYIEERGDSAPQVIHWCGTFHSDFGLGTVSRLEARNPSLETVIVSSVGVRRVAKDLADENAGIGDYVWLIRE